MTFRLIMVMAKPKREVVVRIAGCASADDAKRKARDLYRDDLVSFKRVEEVDA